MLLVAEARVRNSCCELSEPKSDETRRAAPAMSENNFNQHFCSLPNAQSKLT